MGNAKLPLRFITALGLSMAGKYDNTDDYYCSFPNILGFDMVNKSCDEDIIAKCKKIGESGWAIPVCLSMDIDEWVGVIDRWYELVNTGKTEEIADLFLEDGNDFVTSCCGIITQRVINPDIFNYAHWGNEALNDYSDGRYLSCAYILIALFEGLVRTCPISANKRKLQVYFNESAKVQMESVDVNERQDKLGYMIERYWLLPSLEGFIQRVYVMQPAEQFGDSKNIEPIALKRDWLMHGMTKKTIGKEECLQLFNAIATFACMSDDMLTC